MFILICRLGLFNRKLIDQYGFQSSQMFPGYFPALDPKHVTINPASYGGKTIWFAQKVCIDIFLRESCLACLMVVNFCNISLVRD
jgi:hypothetical protein